MTLYQLLEDYFVLPGYVHYGWNEQILSFRNNFWLLIPLRNWKQVSKIKKWEILFAFSEFRHEPY